MFLTNDTVVVGGESSTVPMHSLIEKMMLKSWTVHRSRVRCMEMLGERYMVTGSSCDNMIKVWNVSTDPTEEVECVGSIDTNQRC